MRAAFFGRALALLRGAAVDCLSALEESSGGCVVVDTDSSENGRRAAEAVEYSLDGDARRRDTEREQDAGEGRSTRAKDMAGEQISVGGGWWMDGWEERLAVVSPAGWLQQDPHWLSN